MTCPYSGNGYFVGTMLSVIIPTLNAEEHLRRSLPGLAGGAIAGTVGQLVIADGGSTDATLAMADAAGADVVRAPKGRGSQLAKGAKTARGDWLLFIHADTVLDAGWEQKIDEFIKQTGGDGQRAAVFRFRLDDGGIRAQVLEKIVALRTWALALPYGDQGLLISRALYDRIGGFRAIAIMEDVDIVRRIGRRNLHVIAHDAITSAERYEREGYIGRMARNLVCIGLWFGGVSPERIARLYQ